MNYEKLVARLDPGKMPEHVAIILDGNGRWASRKSLSRSEGHRAGGENLDRLLDFIVFLKIPYLSLYAFSTENWKRPRAEVSSLWKLLVEFFSSRLHRCRENGIRIKVSGDIGKIPAFARKRLEESVRETKSYKNLIANFCVNYGSQDEIVKAADSLIQERLDLLEAGETKKARAPLKKKAWKSACTPIPFLRWISSCVPAGKAASPIFCSGNAPMPSCT